MKPMHWIVFGLVLFFDYSLEETSGPGGFGVGRGGKLRVCVIDGRGYKKVARYCPMVESLNSGIECVIGSDRLDCLRRISKGTVDFGVFSSEDLLAAKWIEVDILVTDELRYHNTPFQYEVVALVNNRSKIDGFENLRGSRLCHPGFGYEADWTDKLANFFESKMVTKSCDPSLTLMENKLKATSEFFQSACKAGPWVSDRARDRTLKSLYPSLCEVCYDKRSCSTSDKYWGRRGPLHCLTEEAGDVAWVRLDDTRLHFGFVGVQPSALPENFAYLCPDGTKRPLLNSTVPCVWIAKPWPVIAAKKKAAVAVSAIASTLSHDKPGSWQSALLNLIEFYHVQIEPLKPQMPVRDYLQHAIGFESANSFAECNPPRHITICTKNIISRHKCDWLAETARAYGVDPELQCVSDTDASASRRTPEEFCFDAVRSGRAEVAMAHPDWQLIAKRSYNLEPLLFEYPKIMSELYVVGAVVNQNSSIKTFEDMRGKKACFSTYDGVAWHSVVNYFKNNNLFENFKCPYEDDVAEFFDGVCLPGYGGKNEKLTKLCGHRELYRGEVGALRCVVDGVADVAFVGIAMLNVTGVEAMEALGRDYNPGDYRVVPPPTNKNDGFISWSSIGHIYTMSNKSDMRKQEIINTFKELDLLFGKNTAYQVNAFSMYGQFEHQHNVLFQDRTKYLKTYREIAESRLHYNYEVMVKEFTFGKCQNSAGKMLLSLSAASVCLIALILLQSQWFE